MFWFKKEKIEPYEEIPREDATPLEALYISEEMKKDILSVRNVFFALIMQLYRKEYINFEKLSTGMHNIVVSYESVDFFNSNYKKIMEDNTCFDDMDESFQSCVGGFYNGIMEMIEKNTALMEELEIGYDELAMLILIKTVSYECNGIVTFENIVDTIFKRSKRKVDNVCIETLIFLMNKILAKSMIEKGFVYKEELADTKILSIKNHPEKYTSESKLWKGFKKYLWKNFIDIMQNDKLLLEIYPYYIAFDMEGRVVENIDLEEVYLKPKTIDLLKALSEEVEVFRKLELDD